MVRIALLILTLIIIVSCCKPKEPCKPVVMYETVEVPIYINPLDNVTLERPTVSYFEFSEKGNISLDESNFKILMKNLIELNEYTNTCADIIGE